MLIKLNYIKRLVIHTIDVQNLALHRPTVRLPIFKCTYKHRNLFCRYTETCKITNIRIDFSILFIKALRFK